MIDKLQEYLEQYEWTFEKVDENTLLTGFIDSDEFLYPISISVKNDIITVIVTFKSSAEKITTNNEILILMLRFNFAWPMVKIGMDEDLTIVLAVDFPADGINYNTFAFGLDILTETAQMLANEFKEVIEAT